MSGLSKGIVSGSRCVGPAELDGRVRRVAAGFTALGVAPGQCVAILMRNDIAFMEAAYAAQTLGAYAVPINWHFKAEEIGYILADCGARVLIGHADLLAPIAAELPAGVTPIAVSDAAGGGDRLWLAPVPAAHGGRARSEYEAWLARQTPYARRACCRRRSPCSTPPAPPAIPRACAVRRRRRSRWARSSACAATSSASCPASAASCRGRSITRRPTPFAMRAGRVGEVDGADAALRSRWRCWS